MQVVHLHFPWCYNESDVTGFKVLSQKDFPEIYQNCSQKIDGSFCFSASPVDDSDSHTTGSWVQACIPLASTLIPVPMVWAVGAFWK